MHNLSLIFSDIFGMPDYDDAVLHVYNEGGIREARLWHPEFQGFVSAVIMPIYDTPSRPAWATSGEKHRRAVKGIVSVANLMSPMLSNIQTYFPLLPMKIQLIYPRGTIAGDPPVTESNETLAIETIVGGNTDFDARYALEERIVIPGTDVRPRLVFVPAHWYVQEEVWKAPGVVGLPIFMLLFGLAMAVSFYLFTRQAARTEESRDLMETALKSRNRFLAYLCHELRNPLNTTKGFLEWLRETHLTHEQEEYVSGLEQGFHHMARILNDTLDLGRLEAGRVTLEHNEFDLAGTIHNIVSSYKTEASLKGVQLEVKAAEDVPRRIWADETRFSQILCNLLSNAVNVTSEGRRVALHVLLLSPSQDTPSARLASAWRELLPLTQEASRVSQGLLIPLSSSEAQREKKNGGDTARVPATLVLQIIDQGPGRLCSVKLEHLLYTLQFQVCSDFFE